jgi:hypothetical protein
VALKVAGCERMFEEKASGAQRGRPELAKMLDHLQLGNVVTVTRLDRLARATRDLLDIAGRMDQAEAGFFPRMVRGSVMFRIVFCGSSAGPGRPLAFHLKNIRTPVTAIRIKALMVRRVDQVRNEIALGSGLIDQSQKMTAAAMQMAEKNVWAHRS